MGAGASSHDRFSPAEIAASVRELGAAYVQYGSLVEDNAVSGRVVARSLALPAYMHVRLLAGGQVRNSLSFHLASLQSPPAPPAVRDVTT